MSPWSGPASLLFLRTIMCCIIFTLAHPLYQFVVASNRDEFLDRPTAFCTWHAFPPPADFHTVSGSPSLAVPAGPHATGPVLSSIDAHTTGGGTWIGITRTGAFAALTNFTEPAPAPLPPGCGRDTYRSRGDLVKDWLLSGQGEGQGDAAITLETHLASLAPHRDEYAGFNLLAAQLGRSPQEGVQLGYLTNRTISDGADASVHVDAQWRTSGLCEGVSMLESASLHGTPRTLTGCAACGLSNSVFDEPWDKVKTGTALVEEALRRHDERIGSGDGHAEEDTLVEELFEVLGTSYAPTLSSMSDVRASIMIPPLKRPPKTALDASTAAASPSGWYATRTSTVLLVRRASEGAEGPEVLYVERDVFVLDAQGEPIRAAGKEGERRTHFRIQEAEDSADASV